MKATPGMPRYVKAFLTIISALLAIALFFIPVEEIVESINLHQVYHGHTNLSGWSGTTVTYIRVPIDGEEYFVTCYIRPLAASAANDRTFFNSRGASPTAQPIAEESVIVPDSGIAFRRTNIVTTLGKIQNSKRRPLNEKEIHNLTALSLELDAAIKNRSDGITMRRISFGRYLLIRAEEEALYLLVKARFAGEEILQDFKP